MSGMFDEYITSISNTSSDGQYNIICNDMADFTILFKEKIKDCTVRDIFNDGTSIFFETLDTKVVVPRSMVPVTLGRFRFRLFRADNTGSTIDIEENKEIGRSRVLNLKLVYSSNDDVEHSYSFLVYRQAVRSDFNYIDIEEDEALDNYFS